jgi:hypothetical protein
MIETLIPQRFISNLRESDKACIPYFVIPYVDLLGKLKRESALDKFTTLPVTNINYIIAPQKFSFVILTEYLL